MVVIDQVVVLGGVHGLEVHLHFLLGELVLGVLQLVPFDDLVVGQVHPGELVAQGQPAWHAVLWPTE